ncbi:MAG: AAA family ATPase [Bacillota bacterium]
MYRVRLAIADPDPKYLSGLCNYINTFFQNSIRVVSFTRKETLCQYLNSGKKTDILLVDREFSGSWLKESGAGMVFLLSEGVTGEENGGFASIDKYQPGDELVGSLLELYSRSSKKAAAIVDGPGKTRVVTVYSASGGSGKSTVAVNLAIQAGLMGRTVFYLNLETISSSHFLLSARSEKCLSNVLLYVNGEEPVLPARIETARVKDMRYNLDFFLPPESGSEMCELNGNGMANLLRGLRGVDKYDLVVVDTESGLDERNTALIENSDLVVLLVTQDPFCNSKTSLLLDEVRKMGLDPDRIFVPVLNKFRPDRGLDPTVSVDICIPFVRDIVVKNDMLNCLEYNAVFTGYMLDFAKKICAML